MLFFRWLRDCVRNAILGGVQDALEKLNHMAAEQAPEQIEGVMNRLTVAVALLGPGEEASSRRGKK